MSYLNGSTIAALSAALLISSPVFAQEDHSEHQGMDHSEHDMNMDPELMAELRTKVPGYKDATDDQIMSQMMMMGPNRDLYISDASIKGDVGVLILSHGAPRADQFGDNILADAVEAIGAEKPAAISYGMAMMTSDHIQTSIDNLTAAGAKKIIAIPTTSSVYTSLWRQWNYIVADGEESAYASVPKITTDAEIILAAPPSDHPVISDIVLEHANEISENPKDEVVIIVGHGPELTSENEFSMMTLNTHAQFLRDNAKFHNVLALNLQDDAIDPIRTTNVAILRSWVRSAVAEDKNVLVVGFLMTSRGIQARLQADLEGLEYTLNEKGLSQNPKYADWFASVVDENS